MNEKRSNRNKKMNFRQGDVFLIPSERSSAAYLGQIVEDTREEIGAVFCLFFDRKLGSLVDEKAALDSVREVISERLVTPELLEGGKWRVVGNAPVPKDMRLTIGGMRSSGFVGQWITGGGLVPEYLDTFFGLQSKDEWPDLNVVRQFFLPKLQSKL